VIFELSELVRARLSVLGCPLPVVYGDEPTETATFGRERIVFEHDEDSSDEITYATAQRSTPRNRFVISHAGKCTIYVQHASSGAMPFEHRAAMYRAAEAVLIATDDVVRGCFSAWSITSGEILRALDMDGSPIIGGAVYQIKFAVKRAVFERAWDGSTENTITMQAGTLGHRTYASRAGVEDDDSNQTNPLPGAEIACGDI
jgi:hypothetical protein